jgi:hypothetical protein
MQDEVEHGGWKGVAWFLKIINFPKWSKAGASLDWN